MSPKEGRVGDVLQPLGGAREPHLSIPLGGQSQTPERLGTAQHWKRHGDLGRWMDEQARF